MAWKFNVFTGNLDFYDVDTVNTDEKLKVSSNDTTASYLNGKLVSGTGITLTENSDGGDETLSVINSDLGSGAVTTHESTYDHTGFLKLDTTNDPLTGNL